MLCCLIKSDWYDIISSHSIICDSSLHTDGGKIELWDLVSGSNRSSSLVHLDSVTAVKVAYYYLS